MERSDSLKCATSFLAHAVLSGGCIPIGIYCHGLSDRRWSSGAVVVIEVAVNTNGSSLATHPTVITPVPNKATEQYWSMAQGLGTPVLEN